MPTMGEIVKEIADIVQEDLYDDPATMFAINQAMVSVASTWLLPDLDTIGSVTTVVGANTVALPDNFHRNLYRVEHQSNNSPAIKLFRNRARFAEAYGDSISDEVAWVTGVVTIGRSLIYAKRPKIPQALSVFYYRRPEYRLLDSDTPDGLPEAFHQILIHMVCSGFFSRIEDGVEGEKVNTKYHLSEALRLGEELALFIGGGVSLPAAPVVTGDFL